jgi:hypothetical protein
MNDAGMNDAGTFDAGTFDAGVVLCTCTAAATRLPQPSVLARVAVTLGTVANGRYCWEWTGGAFQYHDAPCWVVSAAAPGYRIIDGAGVVVSSMTGGSSCPTTQAAAEAAFPRHAEHFTWGGGPLWLVLDDPNYAGNAEGSPSPSFVLCPAP